MADPKAEIRDRALAAGFDAVGFADAALHESARANLRAFLEAGHHGDMGWLVDRQEQRSHPRSLWADARAVIVLGLNYGPDADPRERLMDAGLGNISVYAQGKDYHVVVKKKLKALAGWLHRDQGCAVKVFVDTAPVMEKPLAMRGGIGWQGKHTNMVSREFGSWLFLGEIFTTLALEPDPPETDHCGRCRACLDACPTDAFPGPYRLDARRCVSYLTIEHQGHIPVPLRPLMGNRIYGCDDCLAACPWNKFAQRGQEVALLPRDELTGPRLAELARLDDAGFRALFAGTAVKRTGRNRFVRNVMIAIGNGGDAAHLPLARQLAAEDNSDLVREAARWATARLAGGDGETHAPDVGKPRRG